MTVPPGASEPSFSAASSMALAMRSLTEPPGLVASYLPRMRAFPLPSSVRSTSGVVPMSASMWFATFMLLPLPWWVFVWLG